MLDERSASSPVDDAFAVEEEEADRYLCCIKPRGEMTEGTHCWLHYLSENWPRFSANSKEDDDKRRRERNGAREGDERESN